MVTSRWESEAMKYSNISLTKEQLKVVNAAEGFYRAIKKNLNLQRIYSLNEKGINWYVDYFPRSITSKSMTIAWILRAGDNQAELNKLFPDQYYRMREVREVVREPDKIKTKMPLIWREEPAERGFYPVLTVLSYLLMCETWECDGLINVKNKEKSKRIEAETTLYRIYINYTGDVFKPFHSISICPKEHVWETI